MKIIPIIQCYLHPFRLTKDLTEIVKEHGGRLEMDCYAGEVGNTDHEEIFEIPWRGTVILKTNDGNRIPLNTKGDKREVAAITVLSGFDETAQPYLDLYRDLLAYFNRERIGVLEMVDKNDR